MGCHFLLQRIFPTQASSPHLLQSPALADGRSFTTNATWEAFFSNRKILITILCVLHTPEIMKPPFSSFSNVPILKSFTSLNMLWLLWAPCEFSPHCKFLWILSHKAVTCGTIPVLPLENKTNHYVSEGHLTWGNWWGHVGTPETDPSVTKSALHVCFHCNLCPFFCFTIINSVRQTDSSWDCIRFSIASNPFLQKSGPIYAEDLLPSLISSFTSVPHGAKDERNQAKIMEIFSCSGFPLNRLNSEPHYLQARKLKSILSINMSWASY